jgi:hypothetical protein
VSLLAAKSPNFGDSKSGHSERNDALLHLIELRGPDDGLNPLHFRLLLFSLTESPSHAETDIELSGAQTVKSKLLMECISKTEAGIPFEPLILRSQKTGTDSA